MEKGSYKHCTCWPTVKVLVPGAIGIEIYIESWSWWDRESGSQVVVAPLGLELGSGLGLRRKQNYIFASEYRGYPRPGKGKGGKEIGGC
jgi:hypothetical protein